MCGCGVGNFFCVLSLVLCVVLCCVCAACKGDTAQRLLSSHGVAGCLRANNTERNLFCVGYGGYTEEQGMVGTQRSRLWCTKRSRVWWVHGGAGYGGYTEEQGMGVHRGAGYGGYTEEQGMAPGYTREQGIVGTQRSRVWWVHRGAGYGGYTEEQGMMGI